MDEIIDDLQASFENEICGKNIKKGIFDVLCPYFVHPEILEQNSNSSSLLSVYEYLIKYQDDEVFLNGIKEILSHYRSALLKNTNETLAIIYETLDEFVDSENKMWTIRNDRPDTEENRSLYDQVMDFFRYTGDSLEISIKDIVSELYVMHLIINKEHVNYRKIYNDNFGHKIKLLLEFGYFEKVLKINPINMTLSDWRNIAMHHSYSIEKNLIVLSSGKSVKNIVKVNFEEFINCVYQVMRSSNILNIARCIFVFDNLEMIREHRKNTKKINEFRDEMLFNQLKMSMDSEGFRIIEIYRDKVGLKIELIDLQRYINADNYIADREKKIAEIFRCRGNGLSTDRIDVKFFSDDKNLVDVFWINLYKQ